MLGFWMMELDLVFLKISVVSSSEASVGSVCLLALAVFSSVQSLSCVRLFVTQ